MSKKNSQISIPGRFLFGGLIVFEAVILFLIIYTWLGIVSEPTATEVSANVDVLSVLGKVALTVLLGWIGFLMCYYGWVIYFYNYNFGRSVQFWNVFTEKAKEYRENGLKTEKELYEELGAPIS